MPDMASCYNPTVWRQMADQARALADRLGNPGLKARMLKIAERFARMAERVEALRAKRPANSSPAHDDPQASSGSKLGQ